jgi:hypothetical protein
MRTPHLASVLVFGFLAPLAAGQPGVAMNDLFDRPNSTNLGPNWFEGEGDGIIENERLICYSPNASWCYHTGFQSSYDTTVVSMDFESAGSGAKIGVAFGFNPVTWGGIEVFLQDNNWMIPDQKVDRIFFNAAINAGNWPTNPTGGSLWYDLSVPMAAGTLKVWTTNNGDTVVAEVTDAATGRKEPLYTASGIRSFLIPINAPLVAVSYARGGACTTVQAWSGQPAGPNYTFTRPRPGEKATFLVTEARPQGAVALAISASPAAVPTPWGTFGLGAPVLTLAVLPTDANGRAMVTLAPLASNLFTGATLYNQAFDYLTPKLSNSFGATF